MVILKNIYKKEYRFKKYVIFAKWISPTPKYIVGTDSDTGRLLTRTLYTSNFATLKNKVENHGNQRPRLLYILGFLFHLLTENTSIYLWRGLLRCLSHLV